MQVTSLAELRRQLAATDFDKLTSIGYRAIGRQVAGLEDGPACRVACLGNVTLDLLPPFLAAHGACEGWRTRSWIGAIGQHMQALAEPALRDFAPDLVLLVLSLPLLRPEAMAGFTGLDAPSRRALRDDVLDHVEAWVRLALSQTRATLLVANFPQPDRPALGVADTADAYGETEFHLELNLELLRRLRGRPRVQLLDLDRVAARIGRARAFDDRLMHLAKMDWTAAMMAEAARDIARHAIAARGAARKCLVLDADNTLWGGVLGEEGPAGVRIGGGDAEGEAFLAFQHRVRSLKDRGVLLAMCSKNNPADVEEVFRLRPGMPLRPEDFATLEIGWEPKHQGLRAIASRLNIGIDSLVFVDDNPVEIELVRQALPEVRTLALPRDPSGYVAALDALPCFEKAVVLPDDAAKTRQYAAAAARTRMAGETDDLAGYLRGLETVVEVRRATAADLPRVQQLFHKTNQFNLTTARYALGELEGFLASPRHLLGLATLRDRFGELGIIAAFLLERDGAALRIDSLLMSCRAMGRGTETAIMNAIKRHAGGQPGVATLTGRFRPTAKNMPVAGFYESQGFRVAGRAADGAVDHALAVAEAAPLPCDWIASREELA